MQQRAWQLGAFAQSGLYLSVTVDGESEENAGSMLQSASRNTSEAEKQNTPGKHEK